jgi:hypothetical protein
MSQTYRRGGKEWTGKTGEGRARKGLVPAKKTIGKGKEGGANDGSGYELDKQYTGMCVGTTRSHGIRKESGRGDGGYQGTTLAHWIPCTKKSKVGSYLETLVDGDGNVSSETRMMLDS